MARHQNRCSAWLILAINISTLLEQISNQLKSFFLLLDAAIHSFVQQEKLRLRVLEENKLLWILWINEPSNWLLFYIFSKIRIDFIGAEVGYELFNSASV